MDRRRIASLAFAVAVALGLCHALCYSTMLPDEVASQFDAHGLPAGAMPRSALIDIQLTVVIGLAALVLVAAGALSRSPRAWLRLPRRAWWLQGAREEATRRDLAARVLWLGTTVEILAVTLFHRVVRVNLGRADSLAGWQVDVTAFVVVVLIWLAALQWRYRRAPITSE